MTQKRVILCEYCSFRTLVPFPAKRAECSGLAFCITAHFGVYLLGGNNRFGLLRPIEIKQESNLGIMFLEFFVGGLDAVAHGEPRHFRSVAQEAGANK